MSTLENLRLRGFVLGVVTKGRDRIQQPKIDSLGIRSLLSALVISEVIGFEKPDARIFKRSLDELGCAGRSPRRSALNLYGSPRSEFPGSPPLQ